MMRNGSIWRAALALAVVASGTLAANAALAAEPALPAAGSDAGQTAFRELFREMIETDTSVSTGNCSALAEKIAARFRNAGFAADQITLFRDPAIALDGGVVITVPGRSKKARPMLLLGHIDVSSANPWHWKTDPFKLIERDGYFYGRGVADMKALDAIWVDTLLRLRAEGFKPKRTIKLALTCGHESSAQANGAEWLVRRRPDLLDAQFALTEGGGGQIIGSGKAAIQTIAIGEMTTATFDIETFSAGGPSSIPTDDNAISKMIDALWKVRAFKFPLHLNTATRSYLAAVGAHRSDALGSAMVRLAADPSDAAAHTLVSADRFLNPLVHTTCLTTLIQGGFLVTAIPQTAKATISCYILPGEDAEGTRTALFNAIGDPNLVMSRVGRVSPAPAEPPQDPRILRPAAKLIARYFQGMELVPATSLLATDGAYLAKLGVPVYGVPGLSFEPDGNSAHGHDERLAVRSTYIARNFLHDLVKVYAAQK